MVCEGRSPHVTPRSQVLRFYSDGPAGGALLPPFSVGYCKGWKRGVMALICLQAVKEFGLADRVPHHVRVLWNQATRVWESSVFWKLSELQRRLYVIYICFSCWFAVTHW